MKEEDEESPPPNLLLVLLETRAIFEACASIAVTPWHPLLERGDGHPVIVIPGFGGNRDTQSCFNPVAQDRFQSAHRVALDAVRKLSIH